ncbi:MAG: biotin/lipoyl-binding protein, partial [Cellulomonas sp.]
MRDSLKRRAGRRSTATPARTPQVLARRRAHRRRLLIGGVATVAALSLVGDGVALAVNGSTGSGYRTATAELGTLEQTIDATGTVASASRYDRAFSVAGTVGAVDVAVGDTVTAGQVLATLDTASLEDAVEEAEQAVADAQQQLEDDIDSQTSGSSTTSSTTGTGSTGSGSTGTESPSGSTSGSSGGSGSTDGSDGGGSGGTTGAGGGTTEGGQTVVAPAVTQAVAAVKAAQQALLAQYQTAQAALAEASSATTAAQEVCQAVLDDGSDDGGDGDAGDGSGGGSTAEPGAEPTEDAADGTTEETTDGAADDAGTTDATGVAATSGAVITGATLSTGTATDDLASCQDAITTVLAAQTTVDDAQTSLMTLVTDLDTAVAAAQDAMKSAAGSGGAGSGGGTTGGSSDTGGSTGTGGTTESGAAGGGATGSLPTGSSDGTGSTSSSTGSSASGMSGSGGSTVATAADLLADQAAIDQAEAELAIAQSRVDLVDLTSPIAGTVAAVSIAAGDEVEASSTSALITVIGDDGYTVSTTVPLSQVDLVEVGQEAALSVRTSDEALTGTVSAVGILNASTTSSDPTYTVDIAVDPEDVALYNGSSAQVSIAVAASDETLTVPSSAVHLDGSTATVQVLSGGTVESVEVARGAVGPELTEIASGLTEGDEVVLADLSQSLVSDDSGSSSGLSGLGGTTDDVSSGQGQASFPGGGGFGGGQLPAG